MKKINYNGKIITTNLGGYYSINHAQNNKTMTLHIKKDTHETAEQMFERLAPYYNHITFYYDTTCIRGLYDLFAYCKNDKRR